MLKVGIVDLGGIARAHCEAIATLDEVEVVAGPTCDDQRDSL